jgi:sugar lactone lactonase YvrE
MSKVVLLKMTDIAASAYAAVNISDAMIATKIVQSNQAFTAKNSQSVMNMCADYSGNIYISDTEAHVIFKLTEGGKLNVLAGSAGIPGNNSALQNVPGTTARFNGPRGIACDKTGNIYVADTGNNQIRVIKDGKVSVLAGNGLTTSGLVDAASNPLQSRFSAPRDVAVDNSGNVYVCDTGNHAIRKITGGNVQTLAGSGGSGDLENVKASKYIDPFMSPNAITVDAAGNLFVLDTGNSKIKKITPNGWIYLFSGSGVPGTSLGTNPTKAYTCSYQSLTAVQCDRNGYLYVVDKGEETSPELSRLIKINTFGVPSVVRDFSDSNATNIVGLAVSPAQKIFVSITSAEDRYSSSSSSSSSSIDSSSSSSEDYSSSSSSSSDQGR